MKYLKSKMKLLKEKIKSNKILYAFFFSILFFAIIFIIDLLSDNLEDLIRNIIYNTESGNLFLVEFIRLIFCIFIIHIFNNNYIYKEKRDSFLDSLSYTWPYAIFLFSLLLLNIFGKDYSNCFSFDFIGLFLLSILVGLFEEFLCRGFIQNEFLEKYGNSRKGIIFSICVSSVLFGLIHYGNLSSGAPFLLITGQVLRNIIFGMSLGFIYFKSKNIWLVVAIHAFWDFNLLFLDLNKISLPFTDAFYSNVTQVIAMVTVILLSILEFYVISKLSSKEVINEYLQADNKILITLKDKKKSKRRNVFWTIMVILFIIFILIMNLLDIKSNLGKNYKFNKLHPDNYVENYININKYVINKNINNSKVNLEFGIKNDYLMIKNNNSNIISKISLAKIYDFAIYEDNESYIILLLVYDGQSHYSVYMSNYLNMKNVNNIDNEIDNLRKSLFHVEIPGNISKIGYFVDLENNKKYPLFRTKSNINYVYKDKNNIYLYK